MQRYFITAESTYETLRQSLNTQLAYPNTLGKTVFQTALQAPRDGFRRVLLAVDTDLPNYTAVAAAIVPLLDSDAVEEIDEATYLAAVASATAGASSWNDITGKPTEFPSLFHTHSVSDVSGAVGTSDSRLSDQRTPTDGSVTDAKITSGGLSTSSLNWAAIQPWAANTAYAKGDLVSNAGIAYRRSAAGTSGTTFNIANWQQITPSEFVGSQITSGTVDIARIATPTTAESLNGLSTRVATPESVRQQINAVKFVDAGVFTHTTVGSGNSGTPSNFLLRNSTGGTANSSSLSRIGNEYYILLGWANSANAYNGVTYWTRPQAFAFRVFIQSFSANAIARVQFGKSQATTTVGRMAAAGIGIELVYANATNVRLWLLAHNGSSLTATNTGINIAVNSNYDIVLSSDAAGNVSCRINGGAVGTPTTTGGPTTGVIQGITTEILNGTDALNSDLYIHRFIHFTNLS